jgi:hypothetical protein
MSYVTSFSVTKIARSIRNKYVVCHKTQTETRDHEDRIRRRSRDFHLVWTRKQLHKSGTAVQETAITITISALGETQKEQ